MLKCEYCGKDFQGEEELRAHLVEKHSDRIKLYKFEHPETKK
jgi:hypothetical protein